MRSLSLLGVVAALAVQAACTCHDLVEPPSPPVRRAEARIALRDASPETAQALWEAMGAAGRFETALPQEPAHCVLRTIWPVQGADAVVLYDDTVTSGPDCNDEPRDRTLRLVRTLSQRPDTPVPTLQGYGRPRLTHVQRWMGIGWAQGHEADGVRDAAPFLTLGPVRIDERLPDGVSRTELPREVRLRAWTFPAWTFGRSTFRVQLTEHDCVDEGATVGLWTLTLTGGDDTWIPAPSRAALEEVIAALGDRVLPGLPVPDETRCAPRTPKETP